MLPLLGLAAVLAQRALKLTWGFGLSCSMSVSHLYVLSSTNPNVVLDVEHAAGQPVPGVPPLPRLQYEGFEPSPFKPDDSRAELEDLKPVCALLI